MGLLHNVPESGIGILAVCGVEATVTSFAPDPGRNRKRLMLPFNSQSTLREGWRVPPLARLGTEPRLTIT